MASAVDSRLAYARLSAVATASRLPTANRGSNNSYTTSWDTTFGLSMLPKYVRSEQRKSHEHPGLKTCWRMSLIVDGGGDGLPECAFESRLLGLWSRHAPLNPARAKG